MTKQSYLLINWIFTGIILVIFIYSAIYTPEGNNHPIKCVHEELTGSKCPTCGMSRGFSAIVRGRFSDALDYQQNSLSVFMFFFVQLILRTSAIVLLAKSKLSVKFISNIDITVSLLLFLFTFRNLIFQTFYLFYKMLLTGNV